MKGHARLVAHKSFHTRDLIAKLKKFPSQKQKAELLPRRELLTLRRKEINFTVTNTVTGKPLKSLAAG